MKSNFIFVTALGEMEEDQWLQCTSDILTFCKQYENTDCVVLTDLPRALPQVCFCGLSVEPVREHIAHTNDHYRYYQDAWLRHPIREVCALGSIYDPFSRAGLQALVDLCCISAISCRFSMYD